MLLTSSGSSKPGAHQYSLDPAAASPRGMTKAVCCFVLLLFGAALHSVAQDAASRPDLDLNADSVEVDPGSGLAVAEGNVRATYGGVTLTADRVEVNHQSMDVAARGSIVLKRGVFEWRGSSITGNFKTKEFSFDQFQGTTGVWYAEGAGGTHHSDGRATLGRTRLSTCEYLAHPHYSISARRVVYRPDGTFKAYHTWYKVGNVPVFYWPVVFGDTSASGGNIHIKPGYDSDWGAYLLLGREWRVTDKVRTELLLHLREKNGVALGNRTQVKTANSDTSVLAYGMRDNDPPETEDGFNRRFDVEEDRYRVNLYHHQRLGENLSLRLRLDALSDIDMLEDWFRRVHRRNPQPRSFADLTYESERFTLALSARPRVNDFFSVVETLPELRLTVPRQPLGGSGIHYQAEASVARLEMKWRDFDQARAGGLADPADYDTWRADALQMLYLPLPLGDVLQVVPRAGLRLTRYARSSDTPLSGEDLARLFEVDDPDNLESDDAIRDYDDRGGSVLRVAGEAGLELRSKFYQVWPGARSASWQVDGLRHVVVPYANYTYAPKPSEEREFLYFFDPVDRLVEQHFVRLGVDQRWQTRRGRKIYTLAVLESYADFHFAKEERHHHLGNFGTRLELKPRSTLDFRAQIVADMGAPAVNRGEVSVLLGDPERMRLRLSYLYRDEYLARTAYSMGSALADFAGENSLLARDFAESHYALAGLEVQLSERTRLGLEAEYDLVEDELATQSCELTRDLHCWVGALRVREDNGDLQVMLVLYLKAFPKVRLDTSM